MKLSQTAIDRPVLATVLSLVIVVFGLIALLRLPNRELPDVDPPVVSITTIYRGAHPAVVESSITEVLEDEVSGIEGIKHMTSVSREQVSTITVQFELYRNVDVAAQEVRDRVLRVRNRLPDEADEPVIAKRDADARPIIWIGLSSDSLSQIEISDLAERLFKDRLQTLPGVATVVIGGGRRYAMRLWLDSQRLTAHGLTATDVVAALERENVDLPSGRVEGPEREFTVRTLGEMHTPEEFNALVIAEAGGTPIHLRDVGRAEVGPEDDRKLVRYNGRPAVGLAIVKQSKANTLAVARAVRREVAAIRSELPADLSMDVAYDSSRFIAESIHDVRTALFAAFALVAMVIYLFLRTLRATLVPVVAIPISIVGTFAVLYFLDYTINVLTLMALTLAIGLVVDDAIVVLENTVRRIEEGEAPLPAARHGIDEISFAVVAATLSLVAVFGPLAFLTDQTGRLFREFGIAVAAAVSLSGFVSLTLSPTMCARILRPGRPESGVKAWLGRTVAQGAATYHRALGAALGRWPLLLLAGIAWIGLGAVIYRLQPQEFVPTDDRGAIITLTQAPEGSTLAFTDHYQREIEGLILATPEVASTFSVVALGIGTPGAVNEGAFFTMLRPRAERERSQQEIVRELQRKVRNVPGLNAFVINPSGFASDFTGAQLSVVIQGFDLEGLGRFSEEILEQARELPGLVNLRTDLHLNKPQLQVVIDRARASDLGVSAREIATTLQLLLGGLDVSTFTRLGKQYNVMVQLPPGERTDPSQIQDLYVRGAGGGLVPLGSVVEVRPGIAPRALLHFDRLRAVTLTGNLLSGFPLGEALRQVRRITGQVLPPGRGYRTSLSGYSENFVESRGALAFAYGLALVIVYLVLAGQFESFVHPITILLAVGLSFTGALLTLAACGQTVNLFSQIGLVMLIGLVTKNSILIVEFANQLRARGMDVVTATREAARLRFRPILMTAVSTIAGIMPIALGFGAGGESRMPLGIAVAGGMFFSTFLTLFVVPAAHLATARLQDWSARRLGGRSVAAPALPPAREPRL